jgi:hypothetical protein
MHAVSLTPHARCMQCHWHRMHDACSVKTVKEKSLILCWCDGIQKKLKMHVVSMTPHAKYDTACTIDERFERPWQPLKGISIKNIYVPEFSYPTTTCMRCHWHRMHDFCVRKSIISRRIRSRIRGPGGVICWKKPRVENIMTLSL